MAPPEIPGLTDLTEIGRGGFGVVYRAEQLAVGRQVAVKVLIEAMLDERSRARFAREGAAMGLLSGHPNIVEVLETGFTPKGDPYLVMPFMIKGSLGSRLDDGPLQWPDVVTIAIKVCGALESAHAAGVLHRDVKPDNILFSKYREPLLADFGIARVANQSTTKTGSVTASVLYAPPEVLNGQSPTPAADVYSLAATMYQALAGKPAFLTDTDESVGPLLMRIMTNPPDDLRPWGVPDPVWQILAAGMAKDPAHRPPSARAFGEALRDAQRACGQPATPMTVPDGPVGGPQPTWATPGVPTAPAGGYSASVQGFAGQPQVGYPQTAGYSPSGPQPYTSGPQPYTSGPQPYQSGPVGPYGGAPTRKAPVLVSIGILISLFGIVLSPLIGGPGLGVIYWGRWRGEAGAKPGILIGWICIGLSVIFYTFIILRGPS